MFSCGFSISMLRFVADENCIKLRPCFQIRNQRLHLRFQPPPVPAPPAVDVLQDKLNKDQGTEFFAMFVCLFLALLCPPISSKSKQKHE